MLLAVGAAKARPVAAIASILQLRQRQRQWTGLFRCRHHSNSRKKTNSGTANKRHPETAQHVFNSALLHDDWIILRDFKGIPIHIQEES
jgi:hypothetical protein